MSEDLKDQGKSASLSTACSAKVHFCDLSEEAQEWIVRAAMAAVDHRANVPAEVRKEIRGWEFGPECDPSKDEVVCPVCSWWWEDGTEQSIAIKRRGKCIQCIVDAGERIERDPYEFEVPNRVLSDRDGVPYQGDCENGTADSQ